MVKYALDCEMVGGSRKSILARVSIVDHLGRVVYDEYVKPTETVTDLRTPIHGITADQIRNGKDFHRVQSDVCKLLSGCVLIGHSLDFDLDALQIKHPSNNIRDLATYQPFRKYNYGDKPSLKDLAYHILGRNIQSSIHSSVEDAKACMDIYKLHESTWN